MGERFLSVDHGMVGHATGPGFPSLCPLTFGVAFLSGLNTVPIMSTRLFLLLSVLAFGLWAGAAPAQEEKNVLPDPNGIYFQFAIYFAPEPKGDPLKEATRIFDKSFASRLTYRAGIVRLTEGAYVEFREVKPKEYAPPEVDYLEHKGFGLDPEQSTQLQDSSTVLVLDFFVVKPKDYDYLVAANELALAVASATEGFIWDEETRELFSPDSWRNVRLPVGNFVFANTSMHAYQLPSKNFRTVSFGMRKLGGPDVMITEYTTPFWEPMSEMMRFLVYQIAAPGPLRAKKSWTGEELKTILKLKALAKDIPPLTLVPAPSEPGDPRNTILTVDFLDYPGKTYEEKQAYAIDRYFRPDGGLIKVWREREKLMALSDEARESLKSKKDHFTKGLVEKEQLVIKAFHQDTYIWLRVKAWVGNDLSGEQVPDVDALGRVPKQPGKEVKVAFDQVFDYLHVQPDGSEEGNETGKLIRSLQKK